MNGVLSWAAAGFAAAAVVLAALVLLRLRGREDTERAVREELRLGREEARAAGKELREEVAGGLRASGEEIARRLEAAAKAQEARLEGMSGRVQELDASSRGALERIRETLDGRVRELQEGNGRRLAAMRAEVTEGMRAVTAAVEKALEGLGAAQQSRLEEMANRLRELDASSRGALERIRETLDARVRELQEGNERKLEEMRRTVDEKLHEALEKRLGESFRLVSDRLEAVHKGLGEMHSLAAGVGDLKRVLSNVKARGTWAEVQLGALLEQVLAPEQFARNVRVKPGQAESVEYAIRLPGPGDDPAEQVWLPVDSKFPQEDYLRLQEAAERGDAPAVQAAADALARAVRQAAREIRDKYVSPPHTTDFAIMFLATEGLYAEVLRQPGLAEEIQREHRVVVAGPTTLLAVLNSLRMGFQTLAIGRRASEVWTLLGAVKTEFEKFAEVLDRVRKHLQTASRALDQTGARTRALERALREVERLPDARAQQVLEVAAWEAAPDAGNGEPQAPEQEGS